MDEPFYWLSARDRVPWDTVYIIICGSVTVVPPGTFEHHPHLSRVDLEEGVEEIGRGAFRGCPNLIRVDCPSSLRAIGDYAFAECERLSEVNLREGVEEVGVSAFSGCDLRRITVPSSVAEIGNYAFARCERLSELILLEGLRRVGMGAFFGCDLERIFVPSSVEEIREEAFESCDNLEEVTLKGGMVMVARGAFFRCPWLGRVTISSIAIVAEAGEDGNGRTAAVTGGIERDPANESHQLILASPHLASMRLEDLTNLTDAIDRIVDTTRGAGQLDLSVRGVSGRIRERFVDHLSTWYRWYKREVTTILELGLWKIELGRAGEAGRRRAAGGGKRARADVPTRDDSRRTCGADPIVGLVLSSLAGPHRRVHQAENAGLIRP